MGNLMRILRYARKMRFAHFLYQQILINPQEGGKLCLLELIVFPKK